MEQETSRTPKQHESIPTDAPPSYEQTNAGYNQPTFFGQAPTMGQPGVSGQMGAYGYPGYAPHTAVSTNNVNVVVSQPQTCVVTGIHRPPDGMVLAIVSCFFCWPMAICALFYASNSRSAADAGDFASALAHGQNARHIGIAAVVVGIIIGIVFAVLQVVLA